MKNANNLPEIDDKLLMFQKQFHLNDLQINQFERYSLLLREWNKKINLTAITDSKKIIADHFQDSVMVSTFVDFNQFAMVADVGAGAGFPSIPLKICFPHLAVVLVEVVQKKITFLQNVVDTLELSNVTISDLDWRTFLRKTDYPIELFCARASVAVEELIRMFSPASPYRSAQLIYWASQSWVAPELAQPFIYRQEHYFVDNKQRRYIFFKQPVKCCG